MRFILRILPVAFATGLMMLLFLASQARAQQPLHVAFMIGEDEYKTWDTLPVFAKQYLEPLGVKCTILQEEKSLPSHFPGLEAIDQADELFISVRRRPLPEADLARVHKFFDDGKACVAIRTACHAFAARPGTTPAAGWKEWADFDTQVLGAHYLGHFANKDGTAVEIVSGAMQNPVLAGIDHSSLHSGGTLYKFEDLNPHATLLMTGSTTDQNQPVKMPVAWTYQSGKSRVFYTSLGYPDDFQLADFNKLLVNAVFWAAGKSLPVNSTSPSAH